MMTAQTQIAQPIFITAEAVALRLGLTPQAFLSKRLELEDHHGFPLPLPWWKRPLKYRADLVDHWIAAQGGPRMTMAPDIAPELLATGKVSLLAEARRV